MNWERLARYCKKTFDTFVDMREEFFICPSCEELVYSCDWQETDYIAGNYYHGKLYCPICGDCLMNKSEDEDE